MPKLRQTCTRCSMRRQKCDRKSPCSRCVHNKEAHLCTTEWKDGYNPNVHRKYPRRELKEPHGTSDNNAWPQAPLSDRDAAGFQTPGINPNGTLAHRERSFSTLSSGESAPATAQAQEEGSNLDFITFGRSEYTDVSIGNLLANKAAYAANKDLMSERLNRAQSHSQVSSLDDSSTVGSLSLASRTVETYHLRSILPEKSLLIQMVDYHEHHMTYWTGGIYHGPSFRKSLVKAYGDSEVLDLQNLDWQWTAFLFSVLSASLIGCPEAVSIAWGFTNTNKVGMARNWGNGAITSLVLGDFASNFSIHSIQAILNLHMSEHLVGSAKRFMVFQTAAVAIARGLNLHRIGPHPDDGKPGLNPEQKEALIQREVGRRIWYALVTQDWLCTTSLGLYTIHPRHFTTIKPGYYDEETMTPAKDGTPTMAHHTNYLNDVARLVIRFQDDFSDATDVSTKYSIVLKYDTKMRGLCDEGIPPYLSLRTPVNPSWPRWVTWARKLHRISCSHKVIMMHQSFLNRSFKCPQYTYTRWACADASKTIIKEMSKPRDEKEPQWWTQQASKAFVVTAGLSLAVDLFHRSSRDGEVEDYLVWVDKSLQVLRSFPNSSLAMHGVRMISALLQERARKLDASRPENPATTATGPGFPENPGPAYGAHGAAGADYVTEATINPDTWPEVPEFNMVDFGDLMETLPLEAGFENSAFWEMTMPDGPLL